MDDSSILEVTLAIMGIAVGTIGFLLRRAINSLDRTLQEIRHTIDGNAQGETGLKTRVKILEEVSAEHHEDIVEIKTTMKAVAAQMQADALKNAESFGEIKASIAEVLSTLKERRNDQS
jgi:uncharacterized protein YoxC